VARTHRTDPVRATASADAFKRADVCRTGEPVRQELSMMDVIMLALGLGFFALSVGYVLACDRL
jgi:hypothetical protein